MCYNLYMRTNEQTRYADYVFNSSYISRKQNKTYTLCKKSKTVFYSGKHWYWYIGHQNFLSKYRNIEHQKFYVNRLTLVDAVIY